ncbi:MAG: hypothetical protein U0269_01075 [Polyangiales bacterium]
MSRRTTLVTLALSALGSSQCTTSATYVEVQIDTDAPESRSFEVSVLAFRGDAPPSAREPLVIERGSAAGQAMFPASFSVVPVAGSSRDHRVTLQLEALVRGRSAAEPDLRFRRTARWQFNRGVNGQVRIFLPVRCATLTTGCARLPPQACTIAALCEERALTCGDDGTCVPPEVMVTPSSDAGFDVQAPPAMDAAMDAAIDAAIDAAMDSAGDSAADARRDAIAEDSTTDSGVAVDTGVSNNGRSCTSSGTCTGGTCITGNYGGGICSSACASVASCPPSWTCTNRTCQPPTTCTGGYVWTDWNGDGSLQLAAMRRLGVSAMGNSFTYACTDASALLQMCEDQLDLSLTGARASVLRGLIAPRTTPTMTPTVRITAQSASVHFRVDNSGAPFNLTVDAPSSVVAIDASGAQTLNFVGTSNVSQFVINAPMAPIHVMGTINGPTTLVANGGFTNTGRINGTLRFGGSPLTPPSCP